jgi:rod shape-determining protein MreC
VRPRRLLAALLLLTLAVAGLDLAGAPGPGALRSAGGAVLGPLERVLAIQLAVDADAPARVRDAVGADAAAATDARAREVATLLAAPTVQGRRFLPARVVAVGRPGAAGPERVTLDVGSRDGVREGLTVVAADGLVGRVVAVSPWTSDVLLVGAADLVVGVRVGASGVLGSVGSGAAGSRRRPPGELSLQLVTRGTPAVGDPVTTLGSAVGPFEPGVRVGTVSAVDAVDGALTASASVTPAVDVGTLDVVGVFPATGRTTPRPLVTGGG